MVAAFRLPIPAHGLKLLVRLAVCFAPGGFTDGVGTDDSIPLHEAACAWAHEARKVYCERAHVMRSGGCVELRSVECEPCLQVMNNTSSSNPKLVVVVKGKHKARRGGERMSSFDIEK